MCWAYSGTGTANHIQTMPSLTRLPARPGRCRSGSGVRSRWRRLGGHGGLAKGLRLFSGGRLGGRPGDRLEARFAGCGGGANQSRRVNGGLRPDCHAFARELCRRDLWSRGNGRVGAGRPATLRVLDRGDRAPALWWPWSHGRPHLYRLRLEATDAGNWRSQSLPSSRSASGRCRAVVGGDGTAKRWEWWLNGRRIFPKGSNYMCDFWLDAAAFPAMP